jgi:hypothetical protein
MKVMSMSALLPDKCMDGGKHAIGLLLPGPCLGVLLVNLF